MSESVQLTADDAALSKASSANLGYYVDDFIMPLLGKDPDATDGKAKAPRRSPLINRGYYARVAAMDSIIDRCAELWKGQKYQIVSLGSGSDTTYFRLKKRKREPSLYVEVDLPDVARRKAAAIKHCKATNSLVAFEDVDDSPEGVKLFVRAPGYCLATVDLRDSDLVSRTLAAAGIDFDAPTLLIAECVFVYMRPDQSKGVLSWIASAFKTAAYAAYEQIRPDDAFGRTMIANLKSRGCPLLSIHEYPTLAIQEARLTSLCGFSWAQAIDMNDVYYKYLPKSDLARIEKLEIFDEFEEWHIMMAHYTFLVAVKAPESDLAAIAEAVGIKKQLPG